MTNIKMNTLYYFFKNLNSSDAQENNNIIYDNIQESDNILNCPISEEDIYTCFQFCKITKHVVMIVS